jgi:hypothetical protein
MMARINMNDYRPAFLDPNTAGRLNCSFVKLFFTGSFSIYSSSPDHSATTAKAASYSPISITCFHRLLKEKRRSFAAAIPDFSMRLSFLSLDRSKSLCIL